MKINFFIFNKWYIDIIVEVIDLHTEDIEEEDIKKIEKLNKKKYFIFNK